MSHANGVPLNGGTPSAHPTEDAREFEREEMTDTARLARVSTGQLLTVSRPHPPVVLLEEPDVSLGMESRVYSRIAAGSGIVGLLASLFVGWAAPLSIAAVIFGLLGRKREDSARASAAVGLTTGIVGIAFSTIWIVFYIVNSAV